MSMAVEPRRILQATEPGPSTMTKVFFLPLFMFLIFTGYKMGKKVTI
jgi:hypothetical protein